MIQILEDIIVDVESNCYGFDFLIRIIKEGVFPIIQIAIPIILVVLCTFDLGKAVIGNDDKENKKTIKKALKRCVYAIIIFFIVTIVNLIFTIVGTITENETLEKWSECWNNPSSM